MRPFAWFQKPPARAFVRLEKVQQQCGRLLAAGFVGMELIRAHLVLRPRQSVKLARRVALRPEIRTPEDERRFHFTARGIEVELRITVDLALHNPARAET